MRGRVYKSTGSWYWVKSAAGHFISCRLRGKHRIKGLKVSNPIAVGDYVHYIEDTDDKGIIESIEDRENYLIRQSVHKTGHAHIVASNIDQAILLATYAYPKTSTGFIDRFLVTAEAYRIPAVILVNKADLISPEERENFTLFKQLYEGLGYHCALISALEDESLETVNQLIYGKTSLFTGHSGVGKSTLLNKILPGTDQKTAEISSFANKGKHTTTFAEMFDIDDTTALIDTPGIKELGLVEMEKEELGHYFPEMREKLNECRFHNCTHLHEPGCAVRDAVESGNISLSRYQSYLSMVEGDDNRR